MLLIENVIISNDVFEIKFSCNLEKCHGLCCVTGDLGAHLTDDEIKIISAYLKYLKKFLPEKNLLIIEKEGFVEKFYEFNFTKLIDEDGPCIFAYNKNNIWLCSFHSAFIEGIIPDIKPFSCKLFPLKLKKYGDYYLLNFQKREECKPCYNSNVYAYEFFKDLLIKQFGLNWYNKFVYEVKRLN